VASSEALDLLHQAMRAVMYRRIAMAIDTARKLGVFVHHCLFVVAQWRHPVAFKVALDMPHWVLLSILPRRTAMAIEMANNLGASVCCCQFRCQL
jgi:hypothetical protein